MGQINKNKLFWFCLVAWLLQVGVLLFWFLPRYDVFSTQDQLLRYLSCYLLWHAGPAHIPFGDLMRPGFLLNLPVVALGGKLYAMGVEYVVISSLAGLIFYWGWFRSAALWALPICLILSLAVGIGVYTEILDYYTVSIIFTLLGLGFYGAANVPDRSYFLCMSLMGLAALSMGVAVMGNLAMAPGVFLMSLIWPLVYRPYVNLLGWFYFILFLLFSGLFLWGYLIDWGILHRLQAQAWVHLASGGHSLVLGQIVMLGFFIFLIVLMGLLFQSMQKTLPAIYIFILGWLGLGIGHFIFAFMNFEAISVFAWMESMGVLIVCSAWVLWGNQKLLGPSLLLLGLFLGLEILNRSISRGSYMWTIYEPLLLLWVLWRVVSSERRLKISEKIVLPLVFAMFYLFCFKNLIAVNYTLPDGLWAKPYWMSQNQVNSDAWGGVKIPAEEAWMWENYLNLYQKYDCQHRGLLAYDQLVPAYVMVHRLPPYDLAWMDAGLVFPVDLMGTGEASVAYLKNQENGWCVLYREGSGFKDPMESPMHRALIFKYLTQGATHVFLLGHFVVTGEQVFMFVRDVNHG